MERLTINYPDGTIQGTGTLDEILLRLAAYEDTGLEPEEAEACKVALMGKTLAEIKEIEGLSIERMKELAKAESEGRLLILPCKVGDTVWDRNLEPWNVISVEWFSKKVTRLHCASPVTAVKNTFSIGKRSLGKTVFLTREEAEAALKGGADG